MDLPDLPNDLFLLIVSYLSPDDAIRCRRVSKSWNCTFTRQDISLDLIKWHFPRCREVRLAAAVDAVHSLPDSNSGLNSFELLLKLELNKQKRQAQQGRPARDWPAAFAEAARRYHHLRCAKARRLDRLTLAGAEHPFYRFYSVGTWNRFLRLDDRRAPFHYPDPEWTYGAEDGLLVYPAPAPADSGFRREMAEEEGWDPADYVRPDVLYDETGRLKHPARCPYRILDLETEHEVPVPFNVDGKVIRRVRLADGVLIVEWAEKEPYHNLNERTRVHRHFVSAFAVERRPYTKSACLGSSTDDNEEEEKKVPPPWTWAITHLHDWKMHFLGLPLNNIDRFFSTHDSTHYAIYVWQPNRSPWGEDDPIESLVVWDISGGRSQHTTHHRHQDRSPPTTASPTVICRLAYRELEFYGIRQRHTPQLSGLAIDRFSVYVAEEEHRWAAGPHSNPMPPRVHAVRCTAVPIAPMDDGAGRMPRDEEGLSETETEPLEPGDVLSGPRWVDACGADGDVNMSFCERARGQGRIGLADGDTDASSGGGMPRLAPSFGAVATGPFTWASPGRTQTLSSSQGSSGAYASSLRWPGRAPCWRHEDFPYLTVSQAVDAAAGVRIAARHCFMMELVSVHVRPAVYVAGPTATAASLTEGRGDSGESGSRSSRNRQRGGKDVKAGRSEAGVRVAEVQFGDEMWGELLGKGYIAGDERWVIGEDVDGRITIVRF